MSYVKGVLGLIRISIKDGTLHHLGTLTAGHERWC